MNNEFWRPGENIYNWFNELSVMRKWEYIEKEGKCKFLPKNNYVNRFTKWVNRFRQLKDKFEGYEDAMKIEAIQINWIDSNESIQRTQDEDWNDSNKLESIHP